MDPDGYFGDVSMNYGKSDLTLQQWEARQGNAGRGLSEEEISSADEFVGDILETASLEHSQFISASLSASGLGSPALTPSLESRPSTDKSRPRTTFIEEELKEVLAAEAAVAAEVVEADIPEQQVAETPEAAATAVAVAEVTTGTPVQYDMAEWHLLSDEC